MDIGILGTGNVAQVLGTRLVELGHRVTLGSRSADHAGAAAWSAGLGEGAHHGTFADAAAGAELVFVCVAGAHAVTAARAAGAGNLEGKVVIDVSNPLDFSNGFPPTLTVCNTDSVGEQLQRAVPGARVVKALNTVANALMVDPRSLAGGDHTLLICGDDPSARAQVAAWLGEWFGWADVLDLGGISNARGIEAWLLLWTRLYATLGTPLFSLKIVR